MSLAIRPLRHTDAIIPTIDQAHENPPTQPHRLFNVLRQHAFHRPEGQSPDFHLLFANLGQRELAGTKMAVGNYHVRAAILSPSPVLGRS
jgi:hypothetical protein